MSLNGGYGAYVAIGVVVLFALLSIVRVSVAAGSKSQPAEEVDLMGLRDQFLQKGLADLGVPISPEEPYVAVMDVAMGPEIVVSVLSAATGDASIYFSTGGGIIGGIGHESVRNASLAFLQEARRHLPKLEPVEEYPHPGVGEVFFYVRTPEGVFAGRGRGDELAEGDNPLSSLFQAGEEVITQLRLVTEAQK